MSSDLRLYFFSETVVSLWNGLDNWTVTSASLNCFKGNLTRLRNCSMGLFLVSPVRWPERPRQLYCLALSGELSGECLCPLVCSSVRLFVCVLDGACHFAHISVQCTCHPLCLHVDNCNCFNPTLYGYAASIYRASVVRSVTKKISHALNPARPDPARPSSLKAGPARPKNRPGQEDVQPANSFV